MANVKSAKKRILTNEKARVKNKIAKTNMKKVIKSVNVLVAAETPDAAKIEEAKTAAVKSLGRMSGRKIVNKQKASRLESRLVKKVNKTLASSDK